MIRFLHASDLHLGKPFGTYPEDARASLRRARLQSIPRLAEAARAGGAALILLAGDTFDQMTPSPQVIRQALNAMRQAADITWLMLPGNHDNLGATELWRTLAADSAQNVRLVLEPAPLPLAEGATLLPAPCTERNPGRDLTEWYDTAATGETLRIGLAHGAVRSFTTGEDGASAIIPPDRAARSGLDYLALGDWHGQMRIGPATWYSGAPEADGFRHEARPGALLVEIAGPGAPARVTPVPTGSIDWVRRTLTLGTGVAPGPALDAVLPPFARRDATLFDLVVSGRAHATDRVALERAIAAVRHDFLWHRADLTGLGAVHDTADLDAIDAEGALRAAAEALAAEASDMALPGEARAAAGAALSHLFTFALEEQ
ncbi:DNA repair exonuclease (plasmid) [Paroceanicella profunda]|uniref:DNA repair exonuclease n=1 Tax=Paroceanicella profunda TaxID=2579971 RepID=A0A5B8FJ91_9RHOB|nr:metallophosphoesterase [Paroceanicella profunda]QDL93978.1 DNA repair exonuclease [Paroceanicella profunda]